MVQMIKYLKRDKMGLHHFYFRINIKNTKINYRINDLADFIIDFLSHDFRQFEFISIFNRILTKSMKFENTLFHFIDTTELFLFFPYRRLVLNEPAIFLIAVSIYGWSISRMPKAPTIGNMSNMPVADIGLICQQLCFGT